MSDVVDAVMLAIECVLKAAAAFWIIFSVIDIKYDVRKIKEYLERQDK